MPLIITGNGNSSGDGSPIVADNIAYLSFKNGNDSTALIGRMDLPYKTLLAAFTAASTTTDGIGRTIFVLDVDNSGVSPFTMNFGTSWPSGVSFAGFGSKSYGGDSSTGIYPQVVINITGNISTAYPIFISGLSVQFSIDDTLNNRRISSFYVNSDGTAELTVDFSNDSQSLAGDVVINNVKSLDLTSTSPNGRVPSIKCTNVSDIKHFDCNCSGSGSSDQFSLINCGISLLLGNLDLTTNGGQPGDVIFINCYLVIPSAATSIYIGDRSNSLSIQNCDIIGGNYAVFDGASPIQFYIYGLNTTSLEFIGVQNLSIAEQGGGNTYDIVECSYATLSNVISSTLTISNCIGATIQSGGPNTLTLVNTKFNAGTDINLVECTNSELVIYSVNNLILTSLPSKIRNSYINASLGSFITEGATAEIVDSTLIGTWTNPVIPASIKAYGLKTNNVLPLNVVISEGSYIVTTLT